MCVHSRRLLLVAYALRCGVVVHNVQEHFLLSGLFSSLFIEPCTGAACGCGSFQLLFSASPKDISVGSWSKCLVGCVRSSHRWHRYSFIFVDHFRQSWFRSLLAAGVGCAAGTPWWTSTPPPSFENVLPAPGGGTAARRWLFFKECSGIRREAG